MSKTVSMSKGREIAPSHDVRIDFKDNVDKELIERDEVFVDKLKEFDYKIEAYTDKKFQPYIDVYNVGKKNCRQIHGTYTEHLSKENANILRIMKENEEKGIKKSAHKPRQQAYEYVLQIGNHETNSTLRMNGESEEQYVQRMERNKEFCRDVLRQIQERYSHCDIVLATYHADEPKGTPHMHIIVQFEGTNYKKGLTHQISVAKALELEGFGRENTGGEYAMQRWIAQIKDEIMTPTLGKFFSEEREVIGEHRKRDDINIFRAKAKREAEEIAQREEAAIALEAKVNQKAEAVASREEKADERDVTLDQRESNLDKREAAADARDKDLNELQDSVSERENSVKDKEEKIARQRKKAKSVAKNLPDMSKLTTKKSIFGNTVALEGFTSEDEANAIIDAAKLLPSIMADCETRIAAAESRAKKAEADLNARKSRIDDTMQNVLLNQQVSAQASEIEALRLENDWLRNALNKIVESWKLVSGLIRQYFPTNLSYKDKKNLEEMDNAMGDAEKKLIISADTERRQPVQYHGR